MPTYEVTSPDGQKYRATVPDGVSENDVIKHIQQQVTQPTPPQTAPPVEKPGLLANVVGAVAEPVMAMGTGLLAKPAGDVVGLAALGLEGLRNTGLPIAERDPRAMQQQVQRAMSYEPRTAAGQFTTEYNPLALIGRGVNSVGNWLESIVSPPEAGPMRNALGYGVNEIVNQLPMFLGLKAPAVAAAATDALEVGARNVMQSALKPPLKALETGKAAEAIDTLLEQGVNVTRGGAEKLQGRVDIINDNIKSLIQNSPAVIDKTLVADRLQGLVNKFAKQVNPLGDVAAIQKAWTEFMNHPLLNDQIPVKTAQEVKQGTYKALGSKAYGELKGAEIEAQKTLARGLKEEIANAVPEVRPLNVEESQMLNALSLVERRALISANKNPMGLGLLTTNPLKFAGYMADRSELFKSLIARMLNTGAKVTPDMTIAGPVSGAITTDYADQQRSP